MIRIDLPPWFLYSFLFVLGSVFGSFLNVCIYRIPQREPLWDSLRGLWDRPSACPRCGTRIRWYDNLPIIGWLLLRGRCRDCRMRIACRYPLIELLNAVLFVLVFACEVPLGSARLSDSCVFTDIGPQVVPGLGPLSPETFVLLRYAYHMVLIEALVVASFIDFDLRIIPDGSTLPAMMLGLLGGLLVGRVHLVPVWFQSPTLARDFGIMTPAWLQPLLSGPAIPAWYTTWPHVHGLLASLAGLVVGGGIVWIVRILGFWILRREAMGFGDVVLMALIGSFLGWQPTLVAFFIAPVCALLVVSVSWAFHRQRYIPYGPYLSLGSLLVLLGWQPLWQRTERIFQLGPILILVFAVMLVLFALNLLVLQGAKRLLGFDRPVDDFLDNWTAADQHQYQAGEHVDRHALRWRPPQGDWPGLASSHGTLHEERWRRPGGQFPGSFRRLR